MFRFLLHLFILLFAIAAQPCKSQPSKSPYDLFPPLKGDLLLSGSFGEVRTNSFHAGIDFRTGGKIGQQVFASADGFVSRVRVGGTGFGKAIYIQHTNGLTTVYAHLNNFIPQIQEFVKEQQYKRESFEIDIPLNLGILPIKRGQLIGFSGNTGGSGGPHLHYEVRLTKTQNPLNPAFSNLLLNDILSPVINNVWIYPLTPTSSINGINNTIELKVQSQNTYYTVADTVNVFGTIGLGVKAYDYINKGSLRCGIYSLKMFVNNQLRYHFSMDEFSYSESRYANSHIDYALRQREGKRVHRLFKEPNNMLSAYKSLINNGQILASVDSLYKVKVLVEDPQGNHCELSMVLRGIEQKPLSAVIPSPISTLPNQQWLFYNENSYHTEWFDITVPKNSLYNNLNFSFAIADKPSGAYSPIVKILDENTPVHRLYKLKIKADSISSKYESQALIATISPMGDLGSVGGIYSKGFVEAQVNFFGNFFVTIDTLPPTITPINFFNNKDLSKETQIMFIIKDDLSGIASYKGSINNSWALFEYDPKNKLIFYEIDKSKLEKGKTHELTLTVNDNKNNQSHYWATFNW